MPPFQTATVSATHTAAVHPQHTAAASPPFHTAAASPLHTEVGSPSRSAVAAVPLHSDTVALLLRSGGEPGCGGMRAAGVETPRQRVSGLQLAT